MIKIPQGLLCMFKGMSKPRMGGTADPRPGRQGEELARMVAEMAATQWSGREDVGACTGESVRPKPKTRGCGLVLPSLLWFMCSWVVFFCWLCAGGWRLVCAGRHRYQASSLAAPRWVWGGLGVLCVLHLQAGALAGPWGHGSGLVCGTWPQRLWGLAVPLLWALEQPWSKGRLLPLVDSRERECLPGSAGLLGPGRGDFT